MGKNVETVAVVCKNGSHWPVFSFSLFLICGTKSDIISWDVFRCKQMARHVQMIFAISSVYVSYHFTGTLQSACIKSLGQIRDVLTEMKIKRYSRQFTAIQNQIQKEAKPFVWHIQSLRGRKFCADLYFLFLQSYNRLLMRAIPHVFGICRTPASQSFNHGARYEHVYICVHPE